MKNGFTIIEVSILFVIFLIVAFLVAPLSLDDTMQAKNISRWRNVQQDFSNITYSINSIIEENELSYKEIFTKVIKNEIKEDAVPYKVTLLDGSRPNKMYLFDDFKLTYSNAVIAYKFDSELKDGALGFLMYDVNGKTGPNVWGKDVFGYYIFEDKFVPFGKYNSLSEQKSDCSSKGSGMSCSNYYLIGGNFD